jgi:tellurite resistance-related uncharacterized protein
MIRLVTVTGSRTTTLPYMIQHYIDIVDEIFVVAYDTKNNQYDNVKKVCDLFGSKVKLYKHSDDQEYNWETVTSIYNAIKDLYPNDWWLVSDDDEFHVYSKDLKDIVKDCDENGWKIVRGGFVDRIGEDGEFKEVKPFSKNENLFSQFPYAGFFRYPMSKACPNKICIVKGDVEITNGQHYAKNGNKTLWGPQLDNKLIAPIDTHNVQVHHFKWDSTCVERIKAVADIKKDYAYSDEYLKMYLALRSKSFKMDLNDEQYKFEYCPTATFENYKNWSVLLKEIISI